MAKNDRLINSLKEIAKRNRLENINKASNEMVTQIYAALAIALHREYGFGHERINRAFKKSQEIWVSFTGTGDDMVKMCEEETGVKLIYQEPEITQ